MGSFRAIFKKEVNAVLKERTIVLAILIQLIIASLSSVILVGLISFYDPETIGDNSNIKIKVGLIGDGNNPLVGYLQEKGISVKLYALPGNAEEDFKKGAIDAILYLQGDRGSIVDMKLYLPKSDSRATVLLMVLKDPLQKYENYLRENNGITLLSTNVDGKSGTTYEFLYTFIVPMLMLFPAFIAGSIIIDTLSEEFENNTIDTLLSSPVTLNEMLFAKIAAVVFIAAFQCLLWPILLYVNRIYIDNIGLILLLSIFIAAFISAASALITIFFKDRERSQFIYSLLLMILGSLSYFLNPSPFSLMARLATGDLYVGALDVIVYAMPVIALVAGILFVSKKILSSKA